MGLREYVAKDIPTPGKHNGPYWPAEKEAGGHFAAQGPRQPPRTPIWQRVSAGDPEPCLAITSGGSAPPGTRGGKRHHSYLINEQHVIAGLALVAWPAELSATAASRHSSAVGVGCGYQNLGPDPAALGASMREFNPDPELDGRSIAATPQNRVRAADSSGARNSWASFSRAATGREPKAGEADIERRDMRGR